MLTDTEIRKSKPTDKAYRLPDGKGLFLFIAIRDHSGRHGPPVVRAVATIPRRGIPCRLRKRTTCGPTWSWPGESTKSIRGLIEMHDMLMGGHPARNTPVYYKYGLPGSYDLNWGFEQMWECLSDITSGRNLVVYYYNLSCATCRSICTSI